MIGAFFDIDGTLYRDSLLIEHFNRLIRYEVVDPLIWNQKVQPSFLDWFNRSGDYEIYLEVLADAYVEALKGLHASAIEFIANQVIQKTWEKTYIYTRHQVQWHQEQGHEVFFISGSPDFLVSKMAKQYGVRYFEASKYILDEEERFSGEVIPMWDSVSKQKTMNKYVKDFHVNLEESYSYGDTIGDVSMLKATGNPIAINPNRKLCEAILEDKELNSKVKVVVERKDMIFNINLEENSMFLSKKALTDRR